MTIRRVIQILKNFYIVQKKSTNCLQKKKTSNSPMRSTEHISSQQVNLLLEYRKGQIGRETYEGRSKTSKGNDKKKTYR